MSDLRTTNTASEDKNGGIVRAALLSVGVCLLAVLCCLLAYRYDNKYTAPAPQAENGLLELDEQSLNDYPVLMLTRGWEYYADVLLEPADFERATHPVPDEYIYIGQYGGFDLGYADRAPHGSGTYRLTIRLPDTPRTYMLELPEIFSAYRLYIDGKEVAAMGEPEPQRYSPAVGNRTVSFEASAGIEFIFAVSDFSHLYSGIVYPPAFGNAEEVSKLLSVRFLVRAIMCSFVAVIGLLALLIGSLSRRKAMGGLFFAICLCFIGYTAYPITRTFISSYYPFYALEQLSYNAMLALALLLAVNVSRLHTLWRRVCIGVGVAAILATLIMHITLPLGSLRLMLAFSDFMTAYSWASAGLITAAAALAVYRKTAYSFPLLCGVLIFDCALIMDRLLPLYEPIVTGWFVESAGFALVLAIGVTISAELAAGYRETAVLRERSAALDRISEVQSAYYSVLEEKATQVSKARHDMRHHYAVIGGLVRERKIDELEAYLEQTLETSDDAIETYCENNTINMLGNHYRLIAHRGNISFEMRCRLEGAGDNGNIGIADTDLCSVLGNLLENAVEACIRAAAGADNDDSGQVSQALFPKRTNHGNNKPFIKVAVSKVGSMLTIRVANSTDGNLKETDSGAFLSSKRNAGTGFGIDSVKAIAAKYNGSAEFKWKRDECVFESTITLLTER